MITVTCFLCVAQISPPSEHIVLDHPWRPWYQRYQPIGFKLCSRSGNENELRDMITRCNNVGVNYNDLVKGIRNNHGLLCLTAPHKSIAYNTTNSYQIHFITLALCIHICFITTGICHFRTKYIFEERASIE